VLTLSDDVSPDYDDNGTGYEALVLSPFDSARDVAG
jgi:hypothetical protein